MENSFPDFELFFSNKYQDKFINEENLLLILDGLVEKVEEVPPIELPYFPSKLQDLDIMEIKLIPIAENNINLDHPGFSDKEYVRRRNYIGDLSSGYKMEEPIPEIEYLPHETKLWNFMFNIIKPLIYEHGCKKFVNNFKTLEKDRIFTSESIPQLNDINKYLVKKCNWRIKPVNGIISEREFLNCLAFRTFCSTQYIRHHSEPFFSIEPDILHEFYGHISMFLDLDFCDLSQKIGFIRLSFIK
jgi:phenylalanine-4-hydroxylase